MIPSTREIASSIYGAIRLARLDATGHEFFERTAEGALRSFFAAALVAPAYLILLLFRYGEMPDHVGFAGFLTAEAVAYVITWTAFPLLVFHLAGMMGKRDRYFGFLTAYNWSSIVQMTVYLPVIALGQSGLLPEALGEAIGLAATLVMLAYQWFIIRTGLAIGGAAALGLLLLDVMIAVFVSGMADGIALRG